MKVWLEHALAVLRMLAGHPSSAGGWAVFAGVTLLAAYVMLRIMGIAVGNQRATWLMNLILLILVCAVMLAGLTAGRIYLHPLLGDRIEAFWLDVLAAAAALLLLATPLMCLLQRVRYITALVTLLVTGVAAALVFLLVVSKKPAERIGAALQQQVEELGEKVRP